MTRYWVVGGEFSNTDFDHLSQGAEHEKLGPFTSYDEAHKIWSAKAWETVDDCYARYEIIEEQA